MKYTIPHQVNDWHNPPRALRHLGFRFDVVLIRKYGYLWLEFATDVEFSIEQTAKELDAQSISSQRISKGFKISLVDRDFNTFPENIARWFEQSHLVVLRRSGEGKTAKVASFDPSRLPVVKKLAAKASILEYFPESIDYPDILGGEILPLGELWHYVSSTFLNGFVNYGTPISGFVIDRYAPKKDPEAIANTPIEHHRKLNCFGDDIVLLSRVDSSDVYLLLWYDCDVSDCVIGRFETKDHPSELDRTLIAWLEDVSAAGKDESYDEHCSTIRGFHRLSAQFCSGWMSF